MALEKGRGVGKQQREREEVDGGAEDRSSRGGGGNRKAARERDGGIVLATAAPSRRRSTSRPAESRGGEACHLSSSLVGSFSSSFLFRLLQPSSYVPSSAFSRAPPCLSVIAILVCHSLGRRIASFSPSLRTAQLSLSLTRALSFTLDRALSPPSLVHPTLSPTPLLRSLTLSPRSSAKTSIRLFPVAPRYTDPTGPSRRAPRGNVDPTVSHPFLAVSRRHTRAPCVTCYLRVTQCDSPTTRRDISHQNGGATQFALSLSLSCCVGEILHSTTSVVSFFVGLFVA